MFCCDAVIHITTLPRHFRSHAHNKKFLSIYMNCHWYTGLWMYYPTLGWFWSKKTWCVSGNRVVESCSCSWWWPYFIICSWLTFFVVSFLSFSWSPFFINNWWWSSTYTFRFLKMIIGWYIKRKKSYFLSKTLNSI